MGEVYVIGERGWVWHIFEGNEHHELDFPAMVMRCGMRLAKESSTLAVKRPAELALCQKCGGNR